MDAPEGPRARERELGRLLGAWTAVLLVAAASLRAADALPGLVAGVPRGVRRHASLEEAERRLGMRLLLPAYFPDTLTWPPAEIRTAGGIAAAAEVAFASRPDERLVVLRLYESASDAPIPSSLRPPGKVFHSVAVDLDGVPAALEQVLLEPEGVWQELTFAAGGRRVAFRFRGRTEEVLRMARSLVGRAP